MRPGPAMTLTSFDSTMKDLYPEAGSRIKQWVVESRREDAWANETCPRVEVPSHESDAGFQCTRSDTAVQWHHLFDHECQGCNDLQDALRDRTDVAAWRALKASRPPITTDRQALSDEIQADFSMADSPLLAIIRKAQR